MRSSSPASSIAIATLLAATAGAGCGRVPASDAHAAPAAVGVGAADTLYIGVTTVSPGGQPDTPVLGGIFLAVARLNAARPAGAPPLGVRLPPAGLASNVAAAAALRDDPRVAVVVAATGSAAMRDAAPVFGDVEHDSAHAVAALVPLATNPAVARSSSWVFRVCPSDDEGATALARFAADSLGVRRLAVVFRNDLFGRGFTRRIVSELAARGVHITERDPFLPGATRYEAYAARIARDGIDALLVAGNAPDAAAVVHAVHAAGAHPAVLGTDDVAGVAGTLAADPAMRGVRFVTFLDPRIAGGTAADPLSAAFLAAYRGRFHTRPDHRAALSYDATFLAGSLIQELARGPAGSTSNTGYALRGRIRDALAQVGRDRPPFVGVTGAVRFDTERGAVGRQVWIGRVGG